MDHTTRRLSDSDDASFPRTAAGARDEQSEDRDTDEIKSEIAHTREDMAETIDAIQEKLRPRAIVASAAERVKTAATERVRDIAETAGGAAYQVMDRTREGAGGLMDSFRGNPYPAALIGVGVAWWIASAASSRRERSWYGEGRWPESREAGYGARGSQTRESSMLENVEHRAKEYVDDAREYADETTQALRRTGLRAQNQLQRMTHENPLLLGAGALMLGAAFGLALPETERENEWMGEARDAVVDRAQQLAGDAANKVEATARNVADTAADVAKKTTGGMQQPEHRS